MKAGLFLYVFMGAIFAQAASSEGVVPSQPTAPTYAPGAVNTYGDGTVGSTMSNVRVQPAATATATGVGTGSWTATGIWTATGSGTGTFTHTGTNTYTVR